VEKYGSPRRERRSPEGERGVERGWTRWVVAGKVMVTVLLLDGSKVWAADALTVVKAGDPTRDVEWAADRRPSLG
jgi:hypothetical protein